jgi:hypothetical protein
MISGNDAISETLLQFLSNDARDDVVAATGRESDDQADRPVRVAVFCGSLRQAGARGAEQCRHSKTRPN